ncbi:cell division protein FtsL [Alkalibacillus salilacus]|uniref:Cell division protein FtsL n=1 Tax=Alkalibacillus salilacus TaxID=284582 RepID=A0ABT9VCD1_9BACI|nr:cell division protein FtsL [Alkalibacillus salilacus]
MVISEWVINNWYSTISSLIVSSQELIQMIIVITCIVLLTLLYVGVRLYQSNQKRNQLNLYGSFNTQKTEYKNPPND